jgi:hypothetical protein
MASDGIQLSEVTEDSMRIWLLLSQRSVHGGCGALRQDRAI